MEVVAYDPFVAARRPGLVRRRRGACSTLDELLATADVVSLHVPLTAADART